MRRGAAKTVSAYDRNLDIYRSSAKRGRRGAVRRGTARRTRLELEVKARAVALRTHAASALLAEASGNGAAARTSTRTARARTSGLLSRARPRAAAEAAGHEMLCRGGGFMVRARLPRASSHALLTRAWPHLPTSC